MEEVPEDANIEQLLALRQHLLQKLSACNSATSSSACRELSRGCPKMSEQQQGFTRKGEKRLNCGVSDKCSSPKVAKLHILECGDRADEKPSCSGTRKRTSKDDGDALVRGVPVTLLGSGGCPLNQIPSNSPVGNAPLNRQEKPSCSEFDGPTSVQVQIPGNAFIDSRNFLMNERVGKLSLPSFVNPTNKELREVESNRNVQAGSTASDGSHFKRSDHLVVLNEIIPAPPPPPPVNEVVTETEKSPPLEQLSEEHGLSLQTDNGNAGSERSGNDKRIKDAKDIFLSDEEDGENIDMLLEKPVEDAHAGNAILPDEGEIREKIVLAYRGTDYFDVLPEGWVEVTHSSGLPIYLHKATRVCTFSRPYFIGPGSVRHHNVPVSAIPCLHQRRVLKEVEENAAAVAAKLQNALSEKDATKSSDNTIEDPAIVMARLQAPGTKVQTAEDFKERQLDAEALHDYAKAVFKFKKIQTYRFNKWAATRNFHRQRKLAEAERLGKTASSIEVSVGRPSLPSNVKLITVPALEANLKPQHRGFFLNPQGKTSVSVLHEYVQKVLKSTINYHFSETRNSSVPYGCTARLKMNLNNRVLCATSVKEKLMLLQEKQLREQRLRESGEQSDSDFVVLGVGCGNSKKTAKLDAARNALKVLIPDVEFDAEGIAVSDKKGKNDAESEKEDAIALFDMLPIEDSRIFDLSARAGQPSPYLLLQECLKRNAAYGDTEIKLHSVRVKHQRHQFDMDVGKHRVSVVCANKREGKQKASQAMLKKLHPNLDTWGSLIRLYGHETQQKQQEARKSRHSIIKLQGNRDKDSSALEPNNAILDKLKAEMMKIVNRKHRNEEAAVLKRPKLSETSEVVDESEAVRRAADYAAANPDALAALRIDL